jgi:pimeloyl-ACP methyl ester carboxylesterase
MRIRLAVVLGFALACLGCRQSPSPVQAPPPGKLIDIGGRKLHLDCTGNGSPTVILVAGGGAFSIDWALVQPAESQQTRVCSYDRAGLAWSDPGPAGETVEQTVSDLHSLLSAAGEKSPLVLVGASVAGIYIQAYQRAYPNQVAALVFSNSSNRIGRLVNGQAALIWGMTEDQIRSTFPLAPSVKGRAPTREDDPFNRLPKSLQAVRLWLDLQLWQKWDPTKEKPDSTLSWRKEFLEEFAETDAKEYPLGKLPIVVIASDPAASASEHHTHDAAGPRLDFLSSNTVHITAAGSGHEIHLYHPDVVVKGIMQAVVAARNGSPLSGSQPK